MLLPQGRCRPYNTDLQVRRPQEFSDANFLRSHSEPAGLG
jgi:hypothetical protein